jgi:hypothetical protein
MQHREGTAAMARIPLALAAATLAATLGSQMAQAQSSPAYPTPSVPSATGQPMPMPPMAAPGARGNMQRRGMPSQSGMPGSSTQMGSGMGSGMAGTTMTPQGPMVQTPSQPFTGLALPQQGVGDGAYNGGGVVLEYLPDGTRRVVQQ